jgi:hypothetical protein
MARQVDLERMRMPDVEARSLQQERNRVRQIQLPSQPPANHDGGTQREGPIPNQDNHGLKGEGAIRTSPASGPISAYCYAESMLPGRAVAKDLADKYSRQVVSTVTYIDPREFSMLDIDDCSSRTQRLALSLVR